MSELTVYPEMEQRSDEWFAARAGLVTASTIGRLITHGKPDALTFECAECSAPSGEPCIGVRGKPIKTMHPARHAAADAAPKVLTVADNDTSRGLLATLAAERITGHVEDLPMTSAMQRGLDEEPFARDAYAEHFAPVEEVGFLVRDFSTFRIGCSPDGLVGDVGMIEIKSRAGKKQVQTVLADQVPPENYAQLQCALLVSGRQWIDYVSFSGGLPLWVKRVRPDTEWFAAINAAAAHAEVVMTDIVDRFTKATDGLPVMERVLDLDEIQVA